MPRIRSFGVALLTAAALAAPRPAAAASTALFPLCLPGALTTCAALQFTTTAQGGGTLLTLRARSLEGSPDFLGQTVASSGLFAFFITLGPGASLIDESGVATALAEPGASVGGGLPGDATIDISSAGTIAYNLFAGSGSSIEGCTPSALRGTVSLFTTCDAPGVAYDAGDDFVQLSFATAQTIDAADVTALGFVDFVSDANGPLMPMGCNVPGTDPFAPFSGGACLAAPAIGVVPEPATVALVGGGLAALLAGVGFRRRRTTE